MDTPQHITREQFAELVHDALNHLYDSHYLREHPLAHMLLSADTGSEALRSQNLRRTLLDAIHRMRPTIPRPENSPDWRGYRILMLRYVQGLQPTEIMEQLTMARSVYFREQARALELSLIHI